MLEKLSLENDVAMTQIKQNIYRMVENDNWWNLEAYFANLTSALKENDGMMTDSMKKGNKIEGRLSLTISIFKNCRSKYPYCRRPSKASKSCFDLSI